jgi:hypothetical protein
MRRPQFAGQRQIAPDTNIAHLVVDDLEIVGREANLYRAEFTRMNGQIAGDRQRALVVIEHGEAFDMHAIRLQIDATVDLLVLDAERRNHRRPLRHGDRAGGMRIRRGTLDANVRLERSGHVGQRGRKTLHQAEINRAAVDHQVDPIFRGRGRLVDRRRLNLLGVG